MPSNRVRARASRPSPARRAGAALARIAWLVAGVSALGLAGLASPCAAVDYFYKDLPLAKMTQDDKAIALPVIRRALDEGADGQTHTWRNPASGASGSVTLRSAPFSRNGMTCRRAAFKTAAGGAANESAWTVCKTPDGWKVLE